MIKAVIIDFDDTLCLTEEACFNLENQALKRMGRATMSRDIHKQTWGQQLFEAIKIRSPGVDVETFRQILTGLIPEWTATGRLDAITPESFAALDALADQGRELFILTSRTHKEAEHLIAADHELSGRIKAFYYRDNMQYHKPDPRAFDILLKDHGFTKDECVYVGDSPSDAEAAKKAHMHFIASLESGVRTKNDFAPYAVDRFIARFSDLPAAIASLDKNAAVLAQHSVNTL